MSTQISPEERLAHVEVQCCSAQSVAFARGFIDLAAVEGYRSNRLDRYVICTIANEPLLTITHLKSGGFNLVVGVDDSSMPAVHVNAAELSRMLDYWLEPVQTLEISAELSMALISMAELSDDGVWLFAPNAMQAVLNLSQDAGLAVIDLDIWRAVDSCPPGRFAQLSGGESNSDELFEWIRSSRCAMGGDVTKWLADVGPSDRISLVLGK